MTVARITTINFKSKEDIDWGFLLSGAVLASLPVILLFVFIGKYFVSGLTEGAVK